jgi:hypothetical protein
MFCGLSYFNGVPEYVGRARWQPVYWDDLRFPATSLQGGGINDPTFVQFQNNGVASVGVYAWQFSATLNQDLFFWAQLPHTWKQGTALYPHIHWAPMSAAGGDVAWSFEYSIAKVGNPYPLTTQDNIFPAAPGVALEHTLTPFLPMAPTSDPISTMIGCRIRRRGSNVADTYPGLAALLEFDLHYEINTPGSRQQFVK